MKKRNLVETVSFQLVTSGFSHAELLAEMANPYNGAPYWELSVFLSTLRALSLVHQTAHWTASGDPFYGDHLLYERLYNELQPDIDRVAEKAVGLGGGEIVDASLQASHESKLVSGPMSAHLGIVPRPEMLARRSYAAEMHGFAMFDLLVKSLEMEGRISMGLENLIGECLDRREGATYLLRQRSIG